MGILKAAQALKLIANALVLHGFLCVIDFYTVQYKGFLYIILSFIACVLIAILAELAAKKPKSNFTSLVMALCVAAVSGGMAFFSVLPGVIAVFAIAVFAWILFYRHNKSDNKTGYAHRSFILLFIFMFVEGQSFSMDKLCAISAVSGIAFLIITMFLSSYTAHEKFIKENHSVQNFPQEQIRKTYFSLLVVFCSVCLAGAVAFSTINLPLGFLGDITRGALRGIIEALPEAKTIDVKTVPQQGKERESGGSDMALPEFSKSGEGNENIDNIIMAVLTVILIMVILAALVWFIRRIIKNLRQTKNIGSDRIEFAFASDGYEKAKVKKEVDEDEPNDKKIRKMYKKYVLKGTKKDVRKSDTPAILQARIAGDEEKKRQVRAIYEKARYSNEACSSEDAESFKKNMK